MKNAYKLVRIKKTGQIGPLFINRALDIKINVWLKSEDHPTKGFAHRPGWHCSNKPVAPHLKTALKSGERRVWYKVQIKDYIEIKRPESQGGIWYLAKSIKFLEPCR